jgi:hypothetical protein
MLVIIDWCATRVFQSGNGWTIGSSAAAFSFCLCLVPRLFVDIDPMLLLMKQQYAQPNCAKNSTCSTPASHTPYLVPNCNAIPGV